MGRIDWMDSLDGEVHLRQHGPRREVVALRATLSRLDPSGASRLAGALPALNELVLSGTHFPTTVLDEDLATALIADGGCERLAVNAAALDANALFHLLSALGPLRVLDLAGTALDADAVRSTLRIQSGLRELSLGLAVPRRFEHRFTPVLKGGEVLDLVGTLKGLEALSLRGLEIGDEAVLLENLNELAQLDIGETGASDITAQTLARSPNLRKLHIDATRIGDPGLQSLAKHGGLVLLDISETQITGEGASCLTGQRQLRQLSLRGIGVSDVQADLFASLSGLRELDLSGTQVGPRVIASLSAAPSLDSLVLPNVKPEAVRACKYLRGLRHLSLIVDQPPWEEIVRLDSLEELVAPLDESAQLPTNLRRLRTGRLDMASVRRLSQAHSLVSLQLSAGANYLAALPATELPEFRELYASGSDFDDAALRRMLVAPALEALYVSDSQITTSGLQALAEAQFIHTLELRSIALDRATCERISRLRRLHCLDVPGTGLGEAEIALLSGAPNLQSLALDPSQITPNSMAALSSSAIVEIYIYGESIAPNVLSQLGALRGLLELKIMDALIDMEHVKVVAGLSSLRVLQSRFASPQASTQLALLRPDLRGFVGAGQVAPARRSMSSD